MAIFAGEDGVEVGQELTYDYNFEFVLPSTCPAMIHLANTSTVRSMKLTNKSAGAAPRTAVASSRPLRRSPRSQRASP